MDDVFIYYLDLPRGINEMVTPCLDGYTIYIDARLDDEGRKKAYRHAMWHIINGDFDEEGNIQEIEYKAHEAVK